MAAFMGATEISVKKTGQSCTVPNDDFAKLMYYFNSVCSCISDPDNSYTIRRLRDYENYSSLSSDEKGQLLTICLTLSPDKLIGTIFFPSDCGDSSNEFLEVSAVSTKLVVAESLVIGEKSKKIKKIMLFEKSWMERNFINPLRSIGTSHRPPPRRRQDNSCIIL